MQNVEHAQFAHVGLVRSSAETTLLFVQSGRTFAAINGGDSADRSKLENTLSRSYNRSFCSTRIARSFAKDYAPCANVDSSTWSVSVQVQVYRLRRSPVATTGNIETVYESH